MVAKSIPATLKPFFQEYDFTRLNPKKDAHLIIERILQYGNKAELRWLFHTYQQEIIREWVQKYGKDLLPQPHRAFWMIVLDIRA